MNKFLSLFLAFNLFCFSVHAEVEVFSMKKGTNNTHEYFAGSYPGAVMMKVNLLGGVNLPGVYNVPVNSELNGVISYAGGPTKEAKLDEIMVRSKNGDTYKVNKVNLTEFFANEHAKPYRLKPDDYIFVKQEADLINNNVFRASLVVSAIVGTILSAVLIHRTLED